jgi:hypothetical protein
VRRVWHPYTDWEDYRAGMYGPAKDFMRERGLSIDLLRDATGALPDAMMDAVLAWPIAAEHNLTDTGSNRRSWVGQAACCLAHDATEFATCSAWWELSDDQRDAANAVADTVIARWEREVWSGAQTLFG